MAKSKYVPAGGGHPSHPILGDEQVVFKVTGADTDGAFDYFDISVGPLAGPPLHIHLEQDETFHVLSGELRFQLGDQAIDAKAGDYIFIARGTPHGYVNMKQERARAVGVFAPAGLAAFLDELSAYQKTVGGQPDPARVAEIAAKHKQRGAGPPLAVSLGLRKP
jgi:quercetin dioxygenase-like cupin family protein